MFKGIKPASFNSCAPIIPPLAARSELLFFLSPFVLWCFGSCAVTGVSEGVVLLLSAMTDGRVSKSLSLSGWATPPQLSIPSPRMKSGSEFIFMHWWWWIGWRFSLLRNKLTSFRVIAGSGCILPQLRSLLQIPHLDLLLLRGHVTWRCLCRQEWGCFSCVLRCLSLGSSSVVF